MSQLETKTLLQEIKELELTGKKNTSGFFAGNYLSSILGRGLEFHEAKRYISGEDYKAIDWNITARMGDAFVKKFKEEREREIFLAVDISSSMHFGTQQATKFEKALEIVATLGYSAIQNGDRLGLVTFQNDLIDFFRSEKKHTQLLKILKRLIEHKKNPQPSRNTDIHKAIAAIQKQRGKRFMIFFISDFIENDLSDDIRLIQKKHDVAFLHIYDAWEHQKLENNILLSAKSMEGQSKTGRLSRIETFAEKQTFLRKYALKHGIDFLSISTTDSIVSKLIGFFKSHRGQRFK